MSDGEDNFNRYRTIKVPPPRPPPPPSSLQRLTQTVVRYTVFFLSFYVLLLVALIAAPEVLQPHLIYLNWVRFPWGVDWKSGGEAFGFRAGNLRTVYTTTSDGVRLGGWHILPRPLSPAILSDEVHPAHVESEQERDARFDGHLKQAKRVFLYYHGNAGNRATGHRTAMYKIMANVGEGSHVVAFDYRGFGDSDRVRVSEKGVQQDALAAFNWVVSRGVAPSKVLLVGHSLGTGVATFLARNLTLSGVNPGGLVILSGYASIPDAALGYPMVPLLYPFRFVPWLAPHVKALIVERWESVKNVRDVRVPVLIIHGGSDFEILPWQARALFVESLGSRLGKQIVEPPADKASAFAANRDHSHILPYDGYHIRPLAGEEAWLWISDLGPLREEMGDVWYLEVKHAGHNTLSQFEVVADGLKEWAETHGL